MDCSQQTAEYAYGGVPATVPGVVEAEEFDNGGQGVGYSDTTDGNTGGVGGSLLDHEENPHRLAIVGFKSNRQASSL